MHHIDVDVAVIGGGPVGLAAAILSQRAGCRVRVIEAGALCDTVRRFPTHMTFFSEARNIEIVGHPMTSVGSRPTRKEALAYYQRVAEVERVDVRTYMRATRILPGEVGGFTLRLEPAGEAPRREAGELRARFVIVATGYFDQPDRLGVPGENLPHVSLRYDDAAPFWGQRVTIIGGSNGAVEAALDLYRGGATVTVVHRRAEVRDGVKYWLKPDFDNRLKEGAIAARMECVVREITPQDVVIVDAAGVDHRIASDFVLVQIGYRAVDGLLRDCGARFSDNGEQPLLSEQYETSVPGLFVVGSAGFGRETRTVFIENGREHARVAAAAIAARR